MIETLQSFTNDLPAALQWLVVIGLGAIPFVESYLGSVIGVIAGLSPFVAIPAAVLGNIASMLLIVMGADRARRRLNRDKASVEPSPKRAKLKRMFDRFGVAGVSLLGQTVLPSQITSGALVSFGASRNAVIGWQIVSIIAWGILCGSLAAGGTFLFTH